VKLVTVERSASKFHTLAQLSASAVKDKDKWILWRFVTAKFL